MPKSYDIAVLGATAAGYVAAITLAKKGYAVVLLSAPAPPTESPLADWIPADVFRICPALRSVRSAGTDAPFRQVQFHTAALDRQVAYRSRSTAGFLLRSGQLLKALASSARRAGVAGKQLQDEPRMELHEASVEVGAARRFRAAVLLIAQDSPASVSAKLALPARSVPTGRLTVCGLDVPIGRRQFDKALHVVASPTGGEGLGVFFAAGGVLHVRVVRAVSQGAAGPGGGASQGGEPVEALSELIAKLQGGGLLPAKLNLSKATAAMWRPPGGVALDLETHLAKRTLLVGTAGGFASAMTGQTLDPSVRSALVAADVTDRALRAKHVQEALAEYKRKWRNKLADRIRPPETSLRMLLPIVFSNQAMTDRFARAFLYGEHI